LCAGPVRGQLFLCEPPEVLAALDRRAEGLLQHLSGVLAQQPFEIPLLSSVARLRA